MTGLLPIIVGVLIGFLNFSALFDFLFDNFLILLGLSHFGILPI